MKDLAGVKHEKCPRCNGKWKEGGYKSQQYCDMDCGMFAVGQDLDRYRLFITITDPLPPDYSHAYICWEDDLCYVYQTVKGAASGDIITLPILPFDISLERLKSLLNYL